MEKKSYAHGTPSWIDLGSPDIEASAGFYGGLFGWTVEEESGPEAGGYRMCTLGGKAVAGLGPQQNPGPPLWTTYVTVDDVDATAETVTAAGGQVVMPPMEVLTAGKMAIFADAGGAAFSTWQPGDHIGAELVNEPSTLSWNELITTDVEGAKAFYGQVFGWGGVTHEGEMPYTEFKLGDASIAGMMPKPPTMPADVPPHWGVYFAVSDVGEAAAKATELGGAVIMPPFDTPQGPMAVLADPHGATFNVIALPAEG
ncbi:MAG: VOC family protein [Actinomycetota bacterium]